MDDLFHVNNTAAGMLFGVATGDALGVPVEFKSREYLEQQPVTGMTGYGTWNQPPGTWSDDSSLTFCLAGAMTEGYSLERTAHKFILWREKGYWGAHNKVFDIGNTTNEAIVRLRNLVFEGNLQLLQQMKYQGHEYENGNGSLMRILPLVYEIRGKDISAQFEMIWENSALTHRHVRAAMACMIYLKLAEFILNGETPSSAYLESKWTIKELWDLIQFPDNEREHFKRIIGSDIAVLPRHQIRSGGYVIDSLEASLWCLLNSGTYKDVVLMAVNLGQDTDTTGAITGGLAGMYYGKDEIPEEWINLLARKNDIAQLAQTLENIYA